MQFLVMLSLLFVRNFSSQKLVFPFDKLLASWQNFWAQRLNQPLGAAAVFLATNLPILLVLGLLLWWAESLGSSLFILLLHLAIVFYALGRRSEAIWLQEYLAAQARGDQEAAAYYASAILDDEFIDANPQELHWSLVCRLSSLAFDRLFLVLFWYLLLGPLGALLARLTEQFIAQVNLPEADAQKPDLQQSNTQKAAAPAQQVLRLQKMLHWPAARIFGLSLGLTSRPWWGIKQFLADLKNWRLSSLKVMHNQLRLGASTHPEAFGPAAAVEFQLLQERIERSLALWIAASALGVIFLG